MRKIFATIIFTLSILILPTSSFAITQQNTSEPNYLLWFISTVVLLIIAAYGIYKSNKREITVFANYTDVGFVIASVLLPVVFFVIMHWLNVSPNITLYVCIAAFAIFLVAIAKATFLYNNNIQDFILAFYTKMFIPFIAITCIIIALIISMALKREKYERRTKHSQRVTGTALAGFTSAFLIITLVLHNDKFVSISDYLSGKNEV
ncbi:MAG: hypothetical protein J6563_06605 [Gilliamella sp.]|nr:MULTISPECIES: hypothetical protein [Gilliamella]MCO6537774.1 hypothetical protein [Gilliamella sp.]MCO6540356.1 hypothetical protein [Gilliamella sp.]MCO6550671.1 hypothetical protein [Gilliamella sp.]MCO6552626.1 hypothetical protein [Gilliamella sp.]MCO6556888.1 hypothetical protein [Gilliamella sp.]